MSVLPSVNADPHYAGRLIDIVSPDDIPDLWRNTPIEQFILSQNFGYPIAQFDGSPQLLIATCIEFRYALPVPRMYAYVIRRAGGRIVGSEFSLTYALSRGVKNVILIGHNDCGMTKVSEHAPAMIEALVDQGWNETRAAEFVERHAWRYKVKDELDSLQREYQRLRKIFKNLVIAPLFVSLADTKLHIPKWFVDSLEDGHEPCDESPPDDEVLRLL
jgi:hypothetical protein